MAPPEPTTLIGPPEIYKQQPPPQNDDVSSKITNPNLTLTENSSPTFDSTGNPCLDFFFHVVPDTPSETLIERLGISWNHDPLKTLKLVCNLRGVRGTGKSDKEGYYTAAIWLYKNHPKTLALNVGSLAEFGYFKDLPEILFRLLEGTDGRRFALGNWKRMQGGKKRNKKKKKKKKKKSVIRRFRGFMGDNDDDDDDGGGGIGKEDKKVGNVLVLRKEERRIERAKRVVKRFNLDPDFKLLHDKVSGFFAECLRSDVKMLNSGDSGKISLAAKWCPSLDCTYDETTLLCEAIAKKVFPRGEYSEYEGIEEAHYAYRVRDRLRKQVLVPLRKALQLPEVYIGANDWGSIPYNRVASVAMKSYKEKFLKHDNERFKDYLEKVKSGEAKIAAGALLPHEIIGALDDEDGGQVAELQWKRMVDDMAKKGKFSNCVGVCDVSGSMSGTPMEVCVALGVLLSELCEEPWKGKVITFSADPQLQFVEGDTLKSKVEFVKAMDWGMNTNFQKVFDLMLEVAVKEELKRNQMLKRVFVFSDMEFDQASENAWETDYQAIKRKFEESGYGDCVPEIVFWNLRDSKATPVPGNQPGVALVSGFSKNLMSMFLEEGGTLNPEDVMELAISGEEYKKLVVLD